MVKDSFFDTSVILGYGLYSKYVNNLTNMKCWEYVNKKDGKFIICYFVIKEISNFIKRRKIINFEIIQKIKSPEYEIGDSDIAKKELSKNEINKAKQLYASLKNYTVEEVSERLHFEELNLEMRIDQFVKFKLDEKVISIESIDNKEESSLGSILLGLVDNYNDVQVLASAIQEQQKREIFFFVTIDAEHFNPNAYNFIKEDPRLEKYKFPELKNLLF